MTARRVLCLLALAGLFRAPLFTGFGLHSDSAEAQEPAASDPGILRGHLSPVLMGVFTPDGQRAVTASSDHTARLWDLTTGQEIRQYPQHTGPLYCLALSGDGRTLVTGAQDNTARLWDVPVPRPVFSIAGHQGAGHGLALTPDGRWLVSGATDHGVRLWDLAAVSGTLNAAELTVEKVSSVRAGHQAEVRCSAFRNDGNQFATGDTSGRIILWSPFLDSPQGEVGLHAGGVTGLAFHANNQHMISSGADGIVRHWQLPPPPAREISGISAGVRDLAMVPGQNLALLATDDSNVRVFDLNTGQPARDLPKPDQPVTSIALAPDGSLAGIADETGRVRLFNFGDGAERGTIAGHQGAVRDVVFLPDSRRILTAGTDGTARLWTVPAAPVSLDGHGASIRTMVASRNGQWIATGSDDLNVRVWTANGQALRAMGNHQQPVISVAVRHDDAQIASGDAEGRIWLWNPNDGSAQGSALAHTGAVHALEFDRTNQSLLTGGQDGLIRRWTLPPGETATQEVPAGGPVRALVSLNGEGGFAALIESGQQVLRWKPDGSVLPPLNPTAVGLKTLVASTDGTRLLSVNAQGQGFIWAAADGLLQATLPFGGNVSSAVFNRDGTEIAVADQQSRMRIYSVEPFRLLEELIVSAPVSHVAWTGGEQRQIAASGPQPQGILATRSLSRIWEGLTGGATAVAVAPDSARAFAGGADGKIQQWRLADGELERTLEGHSDAVTEMVVTPNGQQLLSAGRDRQVKQWNLGDGVLIRSLDHPAACGSVSITSDNLRAVTSADDGLARVWDLVSGVSLQTFSGHGATPARSRWLSDNQQIVSVAADRTGRLWRTSVLRAFATHPVPVRDLALYNGGAQILTSASDAGIVMSDFNSGQQIRVFEHLQSNLSVVASRADNQRIAAGTADGKVLIWNANNSEFLQALDVPGPVTALAWSVDNQKLAVATSQKTLSIFGPPLPPQSPQPGSELVLHQQVDTASVLLRLAFERENRFVWASQEDGHVSQWAYASPVQTRQFNHGGPVYGVAISRDARTVVTCSADQTVRIFDASTGNQRFQLSGHQGPVHAVALTPDESLVISSGADHTLRLWDATGGRQLKQLATFEETKYSVAVHPDGQRIAAAGADRRIDLINLLTGTVERTLEGHTDYIHCVGFNSRGDRLLSYGYAGQLRIWNTADGRPLFEQRVGRIGNYASYAADDFRVLLSNGDATARLFELPESAR